MLRMRQQMDANVIALPSTPTSPPLISRRETEKVLAANFDTEDAVWDNVLGTAAKRKATKLRPSAKRVKKQIEDGGGSVVGGKRVKHDKRAIAHSAAVPEPEMLPKSLHAVLKRWDMHIAETHRKYVSVEDTRDTETCG